MAAPLAMMAGDRMTTVFRSFSRLRINVTSGFWGDSFLLARPVTPSITVRPCTNVKMSKQLRKMLERGPKKKWYASPVGIHPSAPSGRKKGFSDGQIKRADHISRVLYQYITEIINSGEVSPFLAGKAVEIVRVRVVPDLSSANVYWLSSGSEEDEAIERELRHSEGKIRQVLTSLHLLGRVPFLTFVKDAKLASQQKVLELLKTADLGPEETEEDMTSGLHLEDLGYSAIASDEHSESLSELDTLDPDRDATVTGQAVSSHAEVKPESLTRAESTEKDASSSVIRSADSDSRQELASATRHGDFGPSIGTSLDNSSSAEYLGASGLGQRAEAGRHHTSCTEAENARVGSASLADSHTDQHHRKVSSTAGVGLRSDIYGVPRDRILEKLQTLKQKRPPGAVVSTTVAEPASKSVPVLPLKKQKLSIGRQDYTLRDYWREGQVRTQQRGRQELDADVDNEDLHNR